MALSPEKLAKIINHNSQTLCAENAQGALNKISRGNGKGNFTDMDPNDFHDEWDNFSLSDASPSPVYENFSPSAIENSKMPDAIKQSMINNPIVAGDSMRNVMNEVAANKPKFSQLSEQKQTIIEAPQPVAGNIDYNYLKYIISECIREELSKQPLNESSSLRQIGLSGGKIKLVDNKGNIFSAQLQLEGNVKDRKKKES